MKKIINWILIAGLCFSTIAAQAGTLGATSPYSGFWVGVGGGYISTIINGDTNITMVSATPSVAEFLLGDNLATHFVPVVNAGYFYDMQNNWLLGVKGLYKYIGTKQFDQTWSGTFQNGTYQSAGLSTNLTQDFSLLLTGGYTFGDWLVYGGAGPSLIDVSEKLNGDFLPANSFVFQPVNITHNKVIWGGAAQVGFEYMLPNRFMVDLSYSFLASGKQTIPTINFITENRNNYTTFSQHLQALEQGINLTINKYF